MQHNKKNIIMFGMVTIMMGMLAGCGKEFSDYNCRYWISEAPYICISTENSEKDEIELNGKRFSLDAAWENDGSRIELYDPEQKMMSSEDELPVWSASIELKNGKMYLTVEKDEYGDTKGKTVVLEQKNEKK